MSAVGDARKRRLEELRAAAPTTPDDRATLARVTALADDLERGSSLMWSSTVAKAIREALGGAE